MTRDELLFSICTINRVYDCCIADDDYDCDKCKRLTKEWFDEYDKHVIEQYKADTNLKDTIKDIHDNVAREMYCKGIDDFVKFASDMPTVEEDDGTIRPMWLEEMAERLKGKYNE